MKWQILERANGAALSTNQSKQARVRLYKRYPHSFYCPPSEDMTVMVISSQNI